MFLGVEQRVPEHHGSTQPTGGSPRQLRQNRQSVVIRERRTEEPRLIAVTLRQPDTPMLRIAIHGSTQKPEPTRL
ncbi:hypothetical protein, partial [Arthrobacter sp. TS-15]|uniref:hypothetical protein n=1 Tax=Arthrobacter sp. TS-15 TaxID=2510797 RepID=UPI001EE86D82